MARIDSRRIGRFALLAAAGLVTAELLTRAAQVGSAAWLAHRAGLSADEREASERLARELTYERVLQTVDAYPVMLAPSDKPVVATYGSATPDLFPSHSKAEKPAPGVVRIVFFGESATAEGAPLRVEEQLAKRFGQGKVEVVNVGAPMANSASTLLLLRRFLPDMPAHVVVVEHGLGDLVYYRARGRGALEVLSGRARMDEPALGATNGGGLLGVVLRKRRTPDDAVPAWFGEAMFTEPMSNDLQMARAAFLDGFDIAFVTPPAPDVGSLAPAQRDAFDAGLRLEFPILGGLSAYSNEMSEYRRRLLDLGRTTGALVVDTEAAMRDGKDLFRAAHRLTPDGKSHFADALAEALAPRVAAWLEKGAPLPSRRALAAPRSLEMPPGGLPTDHPRDGTCVRGPCPENACFVPAGKATYGYGLPVLERHVETVIGAIGFGSLLWDEDDGPPVETNLSAFCIDRTEASEADRARCVTASACPPYVDAPHPEEPDPARFPAVMPTAIDAEAYCAFRGGRLPTDAEWEAAARGSGERLMPWGDEWTGKEANYCGRECKVGLAKDFDDGAPAAAPIGRFPGKSPYGLVDAAGNLWEWAADCFASQMHHALPAGTRDPIAAPERGCRRFLRGGSFQSYAGFLEKRNSEGLPDVDVPTRGVRCVYDFGIVHQPILGHAEGR